jgi:hypothetical protein
MELNVMDNTQKSAIKLILLTFLFILLSHYFVVFIHEYAHAFTAWILGYKSSPLDLNYGGTSLSNLLLLSNIDQNINNALIYESGHPGYVALIACAGPGIIIFLFFLSSWLIQNKKTTEYPYLLYFLFFFNFWCLGGTYAYVPVRTFTPSGVMVDVLDIEKALHISPWLIYFFVGYLVIYMIWQFSSKTLISIYVNVDISSTIGRASLMIICVLILYGYCGLAGFVNHGEISHFISATSIFAIPGIIFILWPTHKWVKDEIKKLKEKTTGVLHS